MKDETTILSPVDVRKPFKGYYVDVRCSNCKHKTQAKIPLGEKVYPRLSSYHCPNCIFNLLEA